MARLHYNVIPWSNKYDGPNYYKDGRRGALDDEFWNEDELVDYRRLAKHKKRKPKAKGCPGNDGKAHVYVWVTETRYGTKWNSTYGWFVTDRTRVYTYDKKVCCGCMKVDRSRRRRN